MNLVLLGMQQSRTTSAAGKIHGMIARPKHGRSLQKDTGCRRDDYLEADIGWGFHYAVGIAYAALYLAISRLVLGSGPTLISALVFAIALLVVPWFVMQPALGLGFFAARTPHPSVTRIISISGHAAFGVGLYLGSISTSFL
jgi:hypothetical protein